MATKKAQTTEDPRTAAATAMEEAILARWRYEREEYVPEPAEVIDADEEDAS